MGEGYEGEEKGHVPVQANQPSDEVCGTKKETLRLVSKKGNAQGGDSNRKVVKKRMTKIHTKWDRFECIQWVADAHARRVPNFVKATTKLRTKKQIVKKFGIGVAFKKLENGKAKMIAKGVME